MILKILMLLVIVSFLICAYFMRKYTKELKNFNTGSKINKDVSYEENVNNYLQKNYSDMYDGCQVRLQTGGMPMTLQSIYRLVNNIDLDPWFGECIYFDGKQLITLNLRLCSLKKISLTAFE